MFRLFIVSAIVALVAVFPVSARVLHVPSEYSTIQAGINASVDGDTVLVAPGTYSENLNYSGKSIALISEAGPEMTTIQRGGSGSPVVTISGGAAGAELYGFTIKNGNVSTVGAGVRVFGATASIHGNIIKQNSAASGGAVSIVSGSHVRVFDNVLCNNNCTAMGGAIYCSSGSNTEIHGNVIKNNYTGISGGGIFIEYGSGNNVHHNLITYNRAGVRGGGVLFKDSGHLDNNTIAYDSSVSSTGGGIAFEEHSGHARNNIICNNSGYGVYSYGVNPTLTYNDVWNNAQGGYYGVTPGQGSISQNPQFVGGSPYDFHLTGSSPCIDTGDPSSPLDPDGTPADMGAYCFNHRIQGLALKIGNVFSSQGQPVNVPLLAQGFNQHAIGGLEFHIGFDQSCLEYTGMSSDFLTGVDVNVRDGQFHLIWDDIAHPLFLPDSAALLFLQFTANGELDSTCAINWLPSLVVNPHGEPYEGIDYDSGGVTVAILHQICGHVAYYDSLQPIPGVSIALSGRMFRTETTDQSGLFCFDNLVGGSYLLCPSLSRNDSGVTVSDAIKIRRHIVHLEDFSSPYKYVAADVDTNGSITVTDVIKIRRYLANLGSLPCGNWAFIDSAFAINDDNWAQAPSCIEAVLGEENISNIGIIGVRMGDVDDSWSGLGLLLNALTDTARIEQNTVFGLPGDTVAISMSCWGFNDIAGVELHLTYPSGLSFIGLNSDYLGSPTVNGGSGWIHFIWEDIFYPVSISDGNEVLSLIFRIEENAPELQTISFASAHVADEVGDELRLITSDGHVRRGPTGTSEDNTALPGALSLSQNYPNPFNPTTSIAYGLPTASEVEIGIYDLLGRRVATLASEFQEAGYHQVTWNASAVPSGIYFYQIKANGLTETKKMLLLK